MVNLIKNIPKPSFAIEGNKGKNFPLQGYCMEFDPLDLVNCPIFADVQNNELVLEENPESSILMPCDLTVTLFEYSANIIFNFDNLRSGVEIVVWGSSDFFTVLYDDTNNFVMYSGAHIYNPIIKNRYTNLIVSDENGPRTFEIYMGNTLAMNKVRFNGKERAMKTINDPKIANQVNYVSVYPQGTSTNPIEF